MEEGKQPISGAHTGWHRLEKNIVPIAIGLALVVIGSYVAYHGAWRRAGLGDPDAWGAFGDYFGGTINPLLGLFTLWLLLATLGVTRKVRDDTAEMMNDQRGALNAQQRAMDEQISLLRTEAQERQAKARLETIEGRLADALEAWRELCDNAIILRQGSNEIGLRSVLYSGKEWKEFLRRMGLVQHDQSTNDWMEKARKAISAACGKELESLVLEFAQYCSDYESAGGDKLVTNFYRSRLAHPLKRLARIAYIDEPVARYLNAPDRSFSGPSSVDDTGAPSSAEGKG